MKNERTSLMKALQQKLFFVALSLLLATQMSVAQASFIGGKAKVYFGADTKSYIKDELVINLDESNPSDSGLIEVYGDLYFGEASTINFMSGKIRVLDAGNAIFLNQGSFQSVANSGHILGKVTFQVEAGSSSFKFPTGDGEKKAELLIGSVANTLALSVAFISEDPKKADTRVTMADTLAELSSLEYWDIAVADGDLYSGDVTLYYDALSNLSAIAEDVDNVRVAGWNTGTETWDNLGGTITTGSTLAGGSITFTGYNLAEYAALTLADAAPTETVMTVKLMLEGALIKNSTYGSYDEVMRTDLASKGLIPTTSPYDAVTTKAVDYVANNIVDWVKIELRSAADASVLIAAQDALLKADGSIMMPDGTAGLVFPADTVQAGSYYVVAKHRNHLAIMTADPIALSSTSVAVDFTDPSVAMYHGGSNATDGSQRVLISATLKAMRMGDVDKNGTINFFSDKTAVYNVMKDDINKSMLNIYNTIDLDLDGDAVFFSEGNLLYNNVLKFDGYNDKSVNSIIITTVPAITSGN